MDIIQYKAVLFDLGYTLATMDREVYMHQHLQEIGLTVSAPRLSLAFHMADKFFMREHPGLLGKSPTVFMDAYLDFVIADLNLEIQPHMKQILSKAIIDSRKSGWGLISGVDQTLESLRVHGFKLGLVSNWDKSAREILEKCGIHSLFDVTIVSSEVAMEKPDPRIFQLALSRLGVSPQEALYIGDNYYDDVIGARQAGMSAVLINRFGNLGIEEIDGCRVFSSVIEVAHWLQTDHVRAI